MDMRAGNPKNQGAYRFDFFANHDWVRGLLDKHEDTNVIVLGDKKRIQSYRQDIELLARNYIKISTRDVDFWNFPYEGDFTKKVIKEEEFLPEKDLLCWKAGLYTRELRNGEVELVQEKRKAKFYDSLRKRDIDPKNVTPVKIKIMVTDVMPGHIPDNVLEIHDLSLRGEEPMIEIKAYRTSLKDPPRVTITDDWAYALWRKLEGDVEIEVGKPQNAKRGRWSGYAFDGKPRNTADEYFDSAWEKTFDIEYIIEEGKGLAEKISQLEEQKTVADTFKIIKRKKKGT